jgi:hypothetical protein
MRLKTLVAVVVAAAFVVPLSTQAQSDNFKDLDKDNDGSISREEAKGTPYEKDFSKLDLDSDGKLSPGEHAAAPPAGEKAGAGATKPEAPAPEKKQ